MTRDTVDELVHEGIHYFIGQSVIVNGYQDNEVFNEIPGTIAIMRNPALIQVKDGLCIGVDFGLPRERPCLHLLSWRNSPRLPEKTGFWFSLRNLSRGMVEITPMDDGFEFESLFV